MSNVLPPSLIATLREEVSGRGVSVERQTEALAELFELFTSRRAALSRSSYLDVPRYRLAYLRYHLPVNVARCLCVLRDLLSREPAAGRMETVVDLGAGPGSASLAALHALPPAAGRGFLLTDRSRAALRIAGRLLERSAKREGLEAPNVRYRVQKLPELPSIPPRSLVFLSMVLNELRPSGRGGLDIRNLFRRLEARLRPPGFLVVVEPALRAPGRRLLEAHDDILSSGSWEVLAPCTHQRSCPLLRAPKKPWCHFHLELRSDPFLEEAARPLGLDTERISFSYLALRRLGRGESPRPPAPDTARAIGDPMRVQSGATGLYICREGRREVLEDREASRGDRLRLEKGGRKARIENRWPGGGKGGQRERGAGKKKKKKKKR